MQIYAFLVGRAMNGMYVFVCVCTVYMIGFHPVFGFATVLTSVSNILTNKIDWPR